MKKPLSLILVGIVLGGVALGTFVVLTNFDLAKIITGIPWLNVTVGNDVQEKNGPMDISYVVEGGRILFMKGKAEREVVPGSATKEVFTIFGIPESGDLDGDGDLDAALLITREGGGSGTFFYVALALNEGGAYLGTNAMFLGDRIAPQNINIIDGRAIVNFADRRKGEPFSVPPSMGKSVWVHIDPQTHEISELVKDFEGEADPSIMTLGMKTWFWVETKSGGETIMPKKPNIFGLTFGNNNSLTIKTDCNTMRGVYTALRNTLSIGDITSTLMFCEGSQEGEFSTMLASVVGYHFTSKGELYLEMKNGGTIVLR